ncbi:hypothetical protein R1flu_015758 [Riccia fluitans]|uniref:Uncharacterized protein n=1 Tax=Riccia fluitans TaxID=41844 RepID=A0ABD1YNR7_9MARC
MVRCCCSLPGELIWRQPRVLQILHWGAAAHHWAGVPRAWVRIAVTDWGFRFPFFRRCGAARCADMRGSTCAWKRMSGSTTALAHRV